MAKFDGYAFNLQVFHRSYTHHVYSVVITTLMRYIRHLARLQRSAC